MSLWKRLFGRHSQERRDESSGSLESQMTDLAHVVTSAHGSLRETVFLEGHNKAIFLVFSDGAILSTHCESPNDDRGRALEAEFLEFCALYKTLTFYGTHSNPPNESPLQHLAFGYRGTGPRCLSRFLRAAGFKNSHVETITPPLRLRADGAQIRGVVRGELIEWADGMKMSNVGSTEMPRFVI